MRILGPIVQALVRAMFDTGHDITLRRTVGSKLVGDYHTRRTTLPFQKLSHQTLCRLGIAAALHQHVENKTVLIDGALEPMFLAGDRDDNLIEVPFVTEPAG
ncbi:hypothetical protein BBL07_03080 [Agrobacterium vitis]|nr:hypothetical protein BBL07_03080 [Agrobacterium vitis]